MFGDGTTRDRWSAWAIAGAVLLALVVGLIAVAAVAYVAVDSSAPPRPQQQQPIVVPADAPAGDFFTVLRPGVGGGPVGTQRFVQHRPVDGPDGGVVPGTVVHVATAQSGWGVVDLFSWDEFHMRLDGRRELHTCHGRFSANGGGAGCGNGVFHEPTFTSGGSDAVTQSARVAAVPANAAWIVFETQGGATVAANVVGDTGFAQWPVRAGRSVGFRLLDANHEEIWAAKAEF